jgi:hypothetical protein
MSTSHGEGPLTSLDLELFIKVGIVDIWRNLRTSDQKERKVNKSKDQMNMKEMMEIIRR